MNHKLYTTEYDPSKARTCNINYAGDMSTASKSRLEPGTHSIDRVNPRKSDGGYVMDWSLRLHDGKLLRRRSQGKTKGEVKRRARDKAADLLATSADGDWSPSSPVTDYLDRVVKPSITNTSRLKELSKRRYTASFSLVRTELKGYTIHAATRFRVLEKVLKNIARTAPGSVSSARTVMTTYLLDALVRDDLIDGNPLRGVHLDLPTSPNTATKRRTLTEAEWNTVIKHLLTRDVTPLLMSTKHKNIRESTRMVHARAVRMTLLQSVTGLRISEANQIRWRHVIESGGRLVLDATKDIVKGRKGKEKGRYIPILRDDVAEYLREHREADDHYVIGSPSTTAKPWTATNADDTVPELYRQVAAATGVPLLADLRSHSWRATLNGVYADKLPATTRAAIFGHTEAINDEYYSDRANIDAVLRSTTL